MTLTPRLERALRLASCVPGMLVGLRMSLTDPGHHLDMAERYNRVWDAAAVGGWIALLGLFLSRWIYGGSWLSWVPGPPRGYLSCRQVSEPLRSALCFTCLISLLAVPLAQVQGSGYYSLLSATLACLTSLGLQRWEVSTSGGVDTFQTFYGLQWRVGRSLPAIRWGGVSNGEVTGHRSDEQAYQQRCRRALLAALPCCAVLAGSLAIFSPTVDALGNLAGSLYAGASVYLPLHRFFFWVQPPGVERLLRSKPQPRASDNLMLPDGGAGNGRIYLLMLVIMPWAWVLAAALLGLLLWPTISVAESLGVKIQWLCLPWLVWIVARLWEGKRSTFWHEVDLSSLQVWRHEVKDGYQFSTLASNGQPVRAVGISTNRAGTAPVVSPVLYFEGGDWLFVGGGGDQAWAAEIAMRLAQKALVKFISPQSSMVPAEVCAWIRGCSGDRLSDWPVLPGAAPEVSDRPPVA